MAVLEPYRMSQCTMCPKEWGRVNGVVLRLDLSMVAISPMSMISGESEVVREKVLALKVWSCFAMLDVFRNPKPCRRSMSVS